MLRWLMAAAGAASVLALGGIAGVAGADEAPATPPAVAVPSEQAAVDAPGAPAATGDDQPAVLQLATQPPASTAPVPAAPPGGEEKKVEEPKKGDEGKKKAEEEPKYVPFTITGTADGYYENNFNDPFNQRNGLRVFDVHPGVHFNYAELGIQLNRNGWKQPFELRLDPCVGPQANLFNAFEPSDDEVWRALQQAYVGVNLDKSGNNYVDFGKWLAMCGAEVPEAALNYNYSRSLLYGFAEPFYHMGVRAYHSFTPTDYFAVLVARGWNDVTDNNDSLMGGANGVHTFGKLLFSLTYLGGAEPGLVQGNNGMRNFVDFVATYTASPNWIFVMNGDYGLQDNVQFAPAGGTRQVNWKGVAGYIRRVLDTHQAITLRGEYYDDPQGFTTGTVQSVTEQTLTYEYKFNKYVITRIEARHDHSNQNVFAKKGNQTFGQDQTTLGAAMMLLY